MEYSVTVKGTKIPVLLSLKKMKHVRLKVFPSGEIKLSAPIGTPDSWIQEHLINPHPSCTIKAALISIPESRNRMMNY